MLLVALIFIIVIVFIIAIPTFYGFFGAAPIFCSPTKAIEEALEFVKPVSGEKFYDLGMGNGRVLAVAANKFKLDVFGFEMSPIIYWLAKADVFFRGVKKADLKLCNFYNQDLSGADIVFCFLSPFAMEKLRPKFERELPSGTRVISYAFKINKWQEQQIIHAGYPGKVFIYTKQ